MLLNTFAFGLALATFLGRSRIYTALKSRHHWICRYLWLYFHDINSHNGDIKVGVIHCCCVVNDWTEIMCIGWNSKSSMRSRDMPWRFDHWWSGVVPRNLAALEELSTHFPYRCHFIVPRNFRWSDNDWGIGWLVHQSYFCNHCNIRLIYLGFIVLLFFTIYISIKVPSKWAQWCLKSLGSRLFTQPFVRAQIKENIKATRHWLLWGEFTGDRWTPCTKG